MNRSAAAESEPLKHVDDVLTLGEGDGTIGTIPDDLDAQKTSGRAQVTEFEAFRELGDDLVRFMLRSRGDGDIIDLDGNNDACGALLVDIE